MQMCLLQLIARLMPWVIFISDYLKGKSLAIACPKLDSNQDIYLNKITAMIDHAQINTITVMIMQVPCCGGLFQYCTAGSFGSTDEKFL